MMLVFMFDESRIEYMTNLETMEAYLFSLFQVQFDTR